MCAERLAPDLEPEICEAQIPEDLMGLDIGPLTREAFAHEIHQAKTILWNGPMGVFEVRPFDAGTVSVGHAIARATDQGAISVLGGGDTVAAANLAGVSGSMTHVSTGGGAALEFLEGKELPGIAALSPQG